jgi:hypothetical protein
MKKIVVLAVLAFALAVGTAAAALAQDTPLPSITIPQRTITIPQKTSRVSLILVTTTNPASAVTSLVIGDFDTVATCKLAAGNTAFGVRNEGGSINNHYDLICAANGK